MRTALIGLGRIAWLLEKDKFRYHPCTHAGTIRAHKNKFQLIGPCDRNAEKIQSFQKWWSDPKLATSSNYIQLLKEAKPDLVVIATSLESHFEIAMAAIRAGTKAIVLEKPVSESYAEARKLLKLATKHGVPVWVNFERRYLPAYKFVKEKIQSKAYGPLRSISGSVLVGHSPGAGESGPLLHDAVHWIDLLLWFVGEPERLESRILYPGQVTNRRIMGEHTSFVSFHYPDFSAQLESGGRRKYFEFEMKLDFESGRIECGNKGHFFFKSVSSKKYSGFRELMPHNVKLPLWKNPWRELYLEVYDFLSEKTKSSTSSLVTALPGMRLISQVIPGHA